MPVPMPPAPPVMNTVLLLKSLMMMLLDRIRPLFTGLSA
jgi:hypothetical protein